MAEDKQKVELVLKAQFYILTPRVNPVNAILFFILITGFYLSGCGFQLNRNLVRLPQNAQSVSLTRLENQTYTPRLDLLLRQQLTDRFAQYGIQLTSPQAADLSLTIQITGAGYTREEYAYSQEGVDSYDFVFSTACRLKVKNNNTNTQLFQPPPVITGAYSIKTNAQDLTQSEIAEGRRAAMENMADAILSRLNQDF